MSQASSLNRRRFIQAKATAALATPWHHKFHRVKGGFLCVELRPNGAESEIAFQLRDVDGAVGYEAKYKRSVA